MNERPPHFPPGTRITDLFTVEGLVRLAEGRMFYLVNDHRPDVPHRRCWECGTSTTPRSSAQCLGCGAAFRDRRFLMSSRWVRERFDAYEKFARRQLSHQGIAWPVEVIRQDDQLLSIVPYNGEGLMVDEASPLPADRVLNLAMRLTGTVAFLIVNGVRLAGLWHSRRCNPRLVTTLCGYSMMRLSAPMLSACARWREARPRVDGGERHGPESACNGCL